MPKILENQTFETYLSGTRIKFEACLKKWMDAEWYFPFYGKCNRSLVTTDVLFQVIISPFLYRSQFKHLF